MAEMESQYARQFQKLGDELRATQQRESKIARQLKTTESTYQAQVSQSHYKVGEKDQAVAVLQADKRRLEVRS